MIKLLKRFYRWLIIPSQKTEELRKIIEGIREQVYKGWVFRIGPKGRMDKYYNSEKDQTPNKDGWDMFKDFRDKHPKLVEKIEKDIKGR